MRPPNKNRNNRNKSGRKPIGNVSSRVYESAGPEGKVRGTPQQIIEKYLNMARDAQTSGDRVMSENFLQHAEHYIRLLSAAQQALDDRRAQGQPGGQREGDESGRDDDDFEGFVDRFTQPERPAPQHDERAAPQANGVAQSADPRDQPRSQDRPRREQGQERPRDNDRPRREGGEERVRREGGEERARREGGEERVRSEGGEQRSRRDRDADRPRRDDPAPRGGERRREGAPVAHTPEAFDTIDTLDDAGLGPVATPENAASDSAPPQNAAQQNAAPADAAPVSFAPEVAAPGDAAPQTAEPQTAAQQTAAPQTAAQQTAAPQTAAPEAAAADAAPEKPAPRRRRRRVADADAAGGETPSPAAADQATAD